MAKSPLSTRGWDRINFHSTRLSYVGEFRKCINHLRHIKDSERCTFEFTLKFPPKKSGKVKRG